MKKFYQQEYPKTERYVLDNKGSAEQAKDVFQEAFIAVWRNVHLDKFETRSERSLAAYLYQVAKNKWTDYLRSGHFKNTIQVSAMPQNAQIAEELPNDKQEYLEIVRRGFRLLNENCREVLNRFYYQGEPVQMIATAMNWTEATVRNNKYRCMERLREMLKTKLN